MTLGDTMSLALRNLRQSKLRTALTTLGVSIGIASLAGMVSLGVGLQDQIVGRFMQSGVFDSITVSPLRPPIGRGARERVAGQAPARKLDDEALKEFLAIEHVGDAYPNLRLPVEIALGDFSQAIAAIGVPMSSKGEGVFQTFVHGQFFANESDNACMLTQDIARQMNAQDISSLIGKTVRLSYAASPKSGADSQTIAGVAVRRVDLQCRIVGILERDPSPLPIGGAGLGSGVMIPLSLGKTIDSEIVTNTQFLFGDPQGAKNYLSITVKVKQAQYTQDVEDRIRKLGFGAFSINDALRGAKSAFMVLDIILSLIGSIALAVSSLGIVNTMVMSILERTREIGIMKAIGASDNDVRKIFLIEAAAIGVTGGLMGTAMGWIVGQVINLGANIYIRSQGGTPGTLFSLPLWLIAGSIGFSIVVSLVAGSYPASRAARLNPIQALRHD